MSAPTPHAQRTRMLNQDGFTLWLTGLSGSGKTTIGTQLERELLSRNHFVYLIDGDAQRQGLNRDLGFSRTDRAENIRRLGELCCVLADSGAIAIACAIAPYALDREKVRARHREQGRPFIEVHVDTPLDECRRRDPKGLYVRALAGQIPEFTGISAPYEAPQEPEVRLETLGRSPQDSCEVLLCELERRGLIRPTFPVDAFRLRDTTFSYSH